MNRKEVKMTIIVVWNQCINHDVKTYFKEYPKFKKKKKRDFI